VKFEHATGYKTAANVVTYETRFYEGAYLLGVLAGKTTKSNTLGVVGSFPIPEVIRNIDAFTLGARSVNPKVTTKVIWVDTWYDPGKERQAAEALIAQGADVLGQNTDSPAIVQVAERHGVHAFGWDSDMSKYGPTAQLTANTENWADYYIDEVRKVMAGTWSGGRQTANGIKENMVVLTPLNKSVPADVARLFEEKKRAIIDGKLLPFAGPIKDNAGETKIGPGSALTHEQLMSINWYVDGVDGSIPK
jgi:simple sugar transport system substrate-binding protein